MNTPKEIFTPPQFQDEIAALRQLAQRSQTQPGLIDSLIEGSQNLLSRLSSNDYPEFRAQLEGNLAFTYCNFPSGDLQRNLEKAFLLANSSLEVLRKEKYPLRYVRNHLTLGNCCIQLFQIGRPEKLNEAVRSFEEVLSMKEIVADSLIIAGTLNGLGLALQNVKEGDHQENTARSIRCHQEVLNMSLPEMPQVRHQSTFQKGLAYYYLGRAHLTMNQLEPLADHTESAIELFNAGLDVFKDKIWAYQCGEIYIGLGLVYQVLRTGSPLKNLLRSHAYFQQTLSVTFVGTISFPSEVILFQKARARGHLGSVCYDLLATGYPDKIREGIEHLEKALQFFTVDKFPYQHAQTKLWLGTMLPYSEEGSIKDNFEKAIDHVEQSLAYFQKVNFPLEYARGKHTFGQIYTRLAKFSFKKALDKEKVVKYYTEALETCREQNDLFLFATLKEELANAYLDFYPENKEYIEKAIVYCNEATDSITKEGFPIQYGKNRIFLSKALVQLSTCVDSTTPLIKAMECIEDAFTVLNEDNPLQYINGLLCKGNIHLKWWDFTKEEYHLKEAIQVWELAFPLTIRAMSNADKAELLHLIGKAYHRLSLYSQKLNYLENIEKSIANFEEALDYADLLQQFSFRFTIIRDLAVSLTSLGSAKSEVQSIRRAKKLIIEALKVVDIDSIPGTYANLLHCHSFIISSYYVISNKDYWSGYEKMISILEEALNHCSVEATPELYVNILVELGSLYQLMPNTNREKTETYYQKALTVFDSNTHTERTVGVFYQIGDFYAKEYIKNTTDLSANEAFERAFYLFQKGLEVNVNAKYIQALIHHRLGLLHANKAAFETSITDKKQLLSKSIFHLETAVNDLPAIYYHQNSLANNLKSDLGMTLFELSKISPSRANQLQETAIRNLKASIPKNEKYLPNELIYSFFDLATVYFFRKNWDQATAYYDRAIEHGQRTYQAALTNAVRSTLLQFSSLSDAFLNNAICQVHLNQYEKAVESLENGRTHMIRDSLSINDVLLQQAKPEDRQAYEQAKTNIRLIEAEMNQWARQYNSKNMLLTPRVVLEDRLLEEQTKWKAISKKIQSYLPEFNIQSLGFTAISALAGKEKPLVYISTRLHGTLVAIVPRGVDKLSKEHILWLDDFAINELFEIVYGISFHKSFSGLSIADQHGFIPAQEDSSAFRYKLDSSLPAIQQKLAGPIKERLLSLCFQKAILIPDGQLSLLPFHAMMPEIEVSFIPSAYYLKLCQDQISKKRTQIGHYLGIGNPSSASATSLPFAEAEIEACSAFFLKENVIRKSQKDTTLMSIKDHLAGATHLHFACHGTYDPERPEESALFLAGTDRLTLYQLLTEDTFQSNARLIVLSACQTGIVDQDMLYEMIGFPTIFIQAGLPGVVSTLWSVDDLSTTLLMKRFFHYHIAEDKSPAAALAAAQAWIREGTVISLELLPLIEAQLAVAGAREKAQLYHAKRYYANRMEEKPFSHIYYWGGFYFTGV